jgi:hypothetical protein
MEMKEFGSYCKEMLWQFIANDEEKYCNIYNVELKIVLTCES